MSTDRICDPSSTLIFACSGAADVGDIADKAARELTQAGLGKMFCLAGIGGNVAGIIDTTRKAEKLLVIDGCNIDCARKSLLERDLTDFTHMRVTDLGLEKGSSPATVERIDTVVQQGKKVLEG